MTKFYVVLLFGFFLTACTSDDGSSPIGISELPEENGSEAPPAVPLPVISDEALLDLTQRETFKYFWDFAESNSAAAKERFHPNNPSLDANVVTIGGTGFGLMGILVGIERGFVTRQEAVDRLQKIVDFLENADRFHGAWSHWVNGTNGRVIPFSPLDNGGDLVETAFLAQGLVCIYEYFKNGSPEEVVLAASADRLWKGVEWNWYTNNQNRLLWHWSPNNGFAINLELKGYNETLIAFVMAAASPEYAITKDVYNNGWAANGSIRANNSQYGFPLLVQHSGANDFGGPLFWAHYSFLGLDPRQLSDEFVNYWEVAKNHVMINYNYCVENPLGYVDYGRDAWGLTASYSRNADGSLGYSAHHPKNDLGIIAPTAAIASLPYAPEEALRAMHFFYGKKDQLLGPAGFYDAFSPTHAYWTSEAYLAIDQGPQIIMIENYRSGLLWNLFMQNEDVQRGLTLLGFNF
ncbi:glucoamylase family protein [Arenibacter sp. GZD96]|uniref:glucoamylase family protein n=1 Tax=Aurantibrevibacter litoralis TaxID=3106030 RepID=UPI002AFE14FE|nr:glucoamylase family protein [Arenibacter sp. GZD-96]MEA1785241.1 glucoamylase family protein [Arenibacter sp. GZD-96]